ncbi:hypothetical protein HDV05_008287 [Chytridiales sp. JEL 0842]|nr:hypothetical protein HDV05_008287 [Chytridiales sp. JEL 0842]
MSPNARPKKPFLAWREDTQSGLSPQVPLIVSIPFLVFWSVAIHQHFNADLGAPYDSAVLQLNASTNSRGLHYALWHLAGITLLDILLTCLIHVLYFNKNTDKKLFYPNIIFPLQILHFGFGWVWFREYTSLDIIQFLRSFGPGGWMEMPLIWRGVYFHLWYTFVDLCLKGLWLVLLSVSFLASISKQKEWVRDEEAGMENWKPLVRKATIDAIAYGLYRDHPEREQLVAKKFTPILNLKEGASSDFKKEGASNAAVGGVVSEIAISVDDIVPPEPKVSSDQDPQAEVAAATIDQQASPPPAKYPPRLLLQITLECILGHVFLYSILPVVALYSLRLIHPGPSKPYNWSECCNVCLEPGPDVKSNNCNHLFHKDCIVWWMYERQKTSHYGCPRCKTDLKDDKVYKLNVTFFM